MVHVSVTEASGIDRLIQGKISLADLRGARGTRPRPKFLHFHAVLGKNWPIIANNSVLALDHCLKLVLEHDTPDFSSN